MMCHTRIKDLRWNYREEGTDSAGKRSKDSQRWGHMSWVSTCELVLSRREGRKCRTRRAPGMAEQKGGGLLNRTACAGRRACGTGARPVGTAPQSLQGAPCTGQGCEQPPPTHGLVPRKTKTVPTSAALEAPMRQCPSRKKGSNLVREMW